MNSGTELRGIRRLLLPLRALVELFLSAESAYNSGLHCASINDYGTALRLFQVAERKYKRTGYSQSDGVLAARAAQVRCQLELGRPRVALQLSQSVLDAMGKRVSVRDIDRTAIVEYQKIAADALA